MEEGVTVILLGAPGAGKGTVLSFVSKKYPLEKLSTGDLVRAKVKVDEEFRALVETDMNNGLLLGDDIVEGLLKGRLGEISLEQGIALDGYPRTLGQAETLEGILPEFKRELKKVIYLNVSDETVLERLGGRRQCRECQEIYNIVGMKPKVEGKCDKCGGDLFTRDDDKEEVIRKRLEEYKEKTNPLIDFYREKGILFEVDANNEAPESAAKILAELGVE